MSVRFFLSKFILVLCWFGLIHTSLGQEKTSIKLSDKLVALEKKHNVNFSYNHTFFDTVFLNNDIDCKTITECLTLINKLLPVKFDTTDGINYMVLPERKTILFNIMDMDTSESIPSLQYQINNGIKQYLFIENEVFTLNNIFPLDSIHIHSGFYKSIHLKAEDLFKIKILELSKQQFHLNEIVINGYITKGIDVSINDHSIQINTESLGLLAGETDSDIFNVLKTIPGIKTPSGKPGNLNFRGNTFDQSLLQVDDIPIYHSGHFLGAISPYNSSAITNIEVQRNALPAKWGGRVGGLINMTTYNKIPDSTLYEVSLNTLYAGATIKAKLLDDKLGLLIAARSSYPGFKTPKLEAISTLIFQGSRLESIADEVNDSDDFTIGFSDVNAKLNYKINDKHRTTVSFISIQNDLSAEIQDTNNDQIDYRDLELDNWGVTAKWKANFTEKFSTELRISRSNMNLVSSSEGFVLEERFDLEKYDNTITDTRLITEASYKYTENLLFEGGYTLTEHILVSNEVEEENDIDSEREQNALVHSLFLSLQKDWSERLVANFGLHTNYYEPTHTFYVNPRLFTSYAINNRWFIKSSFGTSNQFIQKKFTNDFDDFNITNQLWYLPNDEISVLKANQAMIGSIFNTSKWLIDFEFYSRNTENITNKSDNEIGNSSSLGIDILIKRKWYNLETWISYSLSKTETEFDKITTDAFYDQRQVINLTGILNLDKWNFAASWGYSSGMPVVYSNNNIISDNNNSSTDRFSGQHQLDISTTYTFYNISKSLKSVVGLSFLNVYNQDNIVNIFQNTSDNAYRKSTGFSPNLQINFFF